MFRDKYTDFYFNNLKSSNFKLWITNSNDLQFNMSPTFNDTFTSPMFGSSRYYEGTTMEKQEHPLKLAAINITKQEWRAITEWLSPQKIGSLSFDWNRNHYYNVKITSAPAGVIWVKSKVDNILEETYNVTFEVTFSTVSDWAALGQIASIPLNSDTNASNAYWEFDALATNAPERYKNDYHIPFLIEADKGNITPSTATGYYIYSNIGWSNIGNGFIYYPFDGLIFRVQTDTSGSENPNYTISPVSSTGEIGSPIASYDIDEDEEFFIGPNCYFISLNPLENAIAYNKQYFLTNPATFSMFLNIMTNDYDINFTLNNSKKINVQLRPETTLDNPIFYNGKANTISYQGLLAQNAKGSDFITLFNTVESDSFILESGKPEIMKVIYEGTYDDFQMELDGTAITCFKRSKFRCTKKFTYDRSNNFIMTIFQEWPIQSNIFDLDNYNEKDYYEGTFTNYTLVNPQCYFEVSDDYLYLNIIYIDDGQDLTTIDEKKYCYISICDTNLLDIEKTELDTNKYTIIDFQTRDVI